MSDQDPSATNEPLPPLSAAVRFLISLVPVGIALTILPRLCFWIFQEHFFFADLIYRWIAAAFLVGVFLFFARVVDGFEGDSWSYIGLPRARVAVTQTAIGVAISSVLITVAMAVVAVAGGLSFRFHVSGALLFRLLEVTVFLIGGALLEELMFRGYPFQRLVEAAGAPVSVAVLSILFGALHLQNPGNGGVRSWAFFDTIAVGVLLAYAYLHSRTLWLPLGIHFGWNFALGVVYGLPVSGLRDFNVLVRSTASGSTMLTGGTYGLENSLTGACVILLGFILVALAPKPLLQDISPPPSSIPSIQTE